MKILFAAYVLVFSGTVHAASAFSDRVIGLAEAFHLERAHSEWAKSDPNCTPPSPTACVNEVCTRLGAHGCDNQSEATEVVRACAGNYGANCLNTVCAMISKFDCDDRSELTQVARACKGNTDGSCVTSTCKKLGSFGCDDLDEVVHVAKACGGSLF